MTQTQSLGLPRTSITDPGDPSPEGADLSVSDDVSRQVYRDTLNLKYGELRQAIALIVLGVAVSGMMAAGGLANRTPGFVYFAALAGVIWAARTIGAIVQLARTNPDRMLTNERVDAAQWSRDLAVHRQRVATVTPVLTYGLAGALTVITLLQMYAGLNHSIQQAALVKAAVFAGEWWRLLTAAFLHSGGFHFSSNTTALIVLGVLVETYAPKSRLPLVFFVSAIAGSVASTFATPITSLGASGGIIGLAGYLFVLSARGAAGTPGWIKKHVKSLLASTALTGVVLFFYIDNAAHLGGGLAGGLLGLITIPKSGRELPPAMSRALDQLGWLSADVLAAGAVFTVWRLLH